MREWVSLRGFDGISPLAHSNSDQTTRYLQRVFYFDRLFVVHNWSCIIARPELIVRQSSVWALAHIRPFIDLNLNIALEYNTWHIRMLWCVNLTWNRPSEIRPSNDDLSVFRPSDLHFIFKRLEASHDGPVLLPSYMAMPIVSRIILGLWTIANVGSAYRDLLMRSQQANELDKF